MLVLNKSDVVVSLLVSGINVSFNPGEKKEVELPEGSLANSRMFEEVNKPAEVVEANTPKEVLDEPVVDSKQEDDEDDITAKPVRRGRKPKATIK